MFSGFGCLGCVLLRGVVSSILGLVPVITAETAGAEPEALLTAAGLTVLDDAVLSALTF